MDAVLHLQFHDFGHLVTLHVGTESFDASPSYGGDHPVDIAADSFWVDKQSGGRNIFRIGQSLPVHGC